MRKSMNETGEMLNTIDNMAMTGGTVNKKNKKNTVLF